MRRIRLPALFDAIFILLLGVYVAVGTPIAPFHGDEGMQIYAANDYFTLFVDRAPERLTTQPPYEVDSDAHLRILNGSVNRYAIGLAWQLAGLPRASLPPRPGWQWAFSYKDNAAQGYLPSEHVLIIARIPSSLFHVASLAMMFAFARSVSGRSVAYAATLIYALHPALLLNGRRALQESAMLCFGLLSLWCAARLTRVGRMASQAEPTTDAKNGVPTEASIVGTPFLASVPTSRPGRVGVSRRLGLWALLALACGLALASKHSGIVFVAAALGWVFVGGIASWRSHGRQEWRPHNHDSVGTLFLASAALRLLHLCGSIALVLVLTFALFVALSPALWDAPLARLGDLVAVRSDLLESQVRAAGEAMSVTARLSALVTQPFIAPVQFYEAPTFADSEIDEMAALYSVIVPGVLINNGLGVVLCFLAGTGILATLVPRWRPIQASHTWGLLLTLSIIAVSLLANPLPWQRYYLPLTTLLCVYTALGLQTFTRALAGFAAQSRA